ncbi:uroporphyrinogen decarboxylase [Deferribacterales bacterium Es71-Z0220]|jgi:uroporphyrinogen decarboxylase|uniref:uroporphyrinogen decarboxylase n=1 Tax=Deferrivibrio essentukiensis TaxID=2880922 RepID=UPI001F607B42|nr:uroporphyrinogen decarboxylase [Deferrivibrio essentukiensis]MBZ4672118.1 uroporphyrinogen decarboxylase [Deferribacteraceae bacterium]MCB4204350.1 uroporphyrinogen decarboxylase [Deferrivibrio essentukiensis]
MGFNTLILDVLEGKKVSKKPVWLMRQAGRYMPEYMAVRKKVSFLELCKTPELACEVTLQPIDILGVDSAILFSDILIPIEPMGVNLDFNPAPYISNPIEKLSDVKKLRVIEPENDVPFVIDTVKLLVKELNVPLIGFSGAPFTLACYMVEGGGSKNFVKIKTLMHTEREAYNLLMDKITESTVEYLQAQIDNGCKIVQVFDTWAGIVSPKDYSELVFPYVKKIVDSLKGAHVIYFAKDSATFYSKIKELGCAGIGVDWKIELDEAAKLLDNKFVLQGNLDPVLLFTDKATLKENIDLIFDKTKNVKGHIFNLGHGILPETPVENVKFLVDYVHSKEI